MTTPPTTTTSGARTAVVISGAAVLIGLSVIPALGYSQVHADGSSVDHSGVSSATSIELTSDLGEIVVVPAGGNDISWRVANSDALTQVEVSDENGRLVIDVRRPDRGWFAPTGIWGVGDNGGDIHLEVPVGTDLSIDSSVGDVNVHGDLADLHLRADVGDVTVAGTASSAVVITDVGDLDARGLWSGGPIELRSDIGDVDLDTGTAALPGEIHALSSMGQVRVAVAPVAAAYDVRASSDLGSVVDDVTAIQPPPGFTGAGPGSTRTLIDAQSSVGDVRVEYSTRG